MKNYNKIKAVNMVNFKDLKNKIVQDATGEELEFPDLQANEAPAVGERIFIDGKTKETGSRVMPDGSQIVFKEGVITEIVKGPENKLKKSQVHRKKSGLVYNDSEGRRVEILTSDVNNPFTLGKIVAINRKYNDTGKVKIGRHILNVKNGILTGVETEQKNNARKI